jgi:hypothetical protein
MRNTGVGNEPPKPQCINVIVCFQFCDDNSISAGRLKLKETAQIRSNKIFKMDKFFDDGGSGGGANAAENLGSHSIWKAAATYVHCSGCSRKNKDVPGYWKSKASILEVFKDAKVVEKLCIDGTCYYLFPEELTTVEIDEGRSLIAIMKMYIMSNAVLSIWR